MGKQEIELLKETFQSPGWKILAGLWEKWQGDKERVKANFLRQGKYHEAALEQGKIDGRVEIQKYFDERITELREKTEDNPSY